MPRISSGAALAAAIKSRLANAEYLRAPSSQQKAVGGFTTSNRKESAEDAAKTDLLRKLGSIERTDPDGKRKVFRFFLEGVLCLEFGRHMKKEEIGVLADSTILRMLDDKALQADMDNAGDKLLRAARASKIGEFGKFSIGAPPYHSNILFGVPLIGT